MPKTTPILIDSPPQGVLLAVDFYEDFIYEKGIAVASVFSLQPSSVYSAELDTPETDRLATDGNATLSE